MNFAIVIISNKNGNFLHVSLVFMCDYLTGSKSMVYVASTSGLYNEFVQCLKLLYLFVLGGCARAHVARDGAYFCMFLLLGSSSSLLRRQNQR